MYYANGDLYQGFWIDGERSGVGTYEYANGDMLIYLFLFVFTNFIFKIIYKISWRMVKIII